MRGDPRRSSGRLAGGFVRALVVLLVPAVGAAQAEAQEASPRLGTVETIAGPGFCGGDAVRDGASVAVRSLAVDDTGVVHLDTGPPGRGLIGRIDAEGVASLIRLGLQSSGTPGTTLAPDASGGVFVAAGTKVLQLAAARVATVAGDPGAPGGEAQSASAGDGGPALEARFGSIVSLASDATGNLYVADEAEPEAANLRIRFVNRSAEPVTFYSGTAQEFTVGPGNVGTITDALDAVGTDGESGPPNIFPGSPVALAVTPSRLYVALSSAGVGQPVASVRMINLGPTEVAAHGRRIAPAATETVIESSAQGESALSIVPGIAADREGNLYLADQANHRILKLDGDGAISTFAGTGVPGLDGNGKAATAARLNRPSDVEVGPWGRVYFADEGNGQVRFVDSAGLIHAGLGNGLGLSWTCQGAEEQEMPRPGTPESVAADDRGHVYMAASSLGQVKRLDPSGFLTTVAGSSRSSPPCPTTAVCAAGGDGGPATDAALRSPSRIALSAEGGLYILDQADARVRLVNLGPRPLAAHGLVVQPGTIETVAGSGAVTEGGAGAEGSPALGAQLSSATSDVAVDSDGNLLIAEGNRVRQVDDAGRITTLLDSRDPTAGELSCCYRITGLALDPAGNLYVGDGHGHRLWFLNRGPKPVVVHSQEVAPGAIEWIAGNGHFDEVGGDGGPARDAVLGSPRGMATDGAGSLYVIEAIAGRVDGVRKIDVAGIITTEVGSGAGTGFNGDGLKTKLTSLSDPADVEVDRCGNLVVADKGSDRVRRVWLVDSCSEVSNTRDASQWWFLPLLLALVVVLFLAGLIIARRHFANKGRKVGQVDPGVGAYGGTPTEARGFDSQKIFSEPSRDLQECVVAFRCDTAKARLVAPYAPLEGSSKP